MMGDALRKAISIVLGSPSGLFRDSIGAMLGSTRYGIHLVGETDDLEELATIVKVHEPDIVVLSSTMLAPDRRLPTLESGRPVRLLLLYPAPPMATAEDFAALFDVLRPRAILPYTVHMDDFIRVVHLVSHDMVVHPASLLYPNRTLVPSRVPMNSLGLSARELEVLGVIATGLSETEASARLGIAERTLQTHVSHINEKLGASNRVHAVAIAVALGLVTPDVSHVRTSGPGFAPGRGVSNVTEGLQVR